MAVIQRTARVLFQGDSITDGGRSKHADQDPNPACQSIELGCGYACIAGAQLAHEYAEGPIWIRNLGISGNRIVDLAARAQEHIWNHAPTLLSILIGVNDTWHHFRRGAGVDIDRYKRSYRDLLTDTKRHCPDVQFVLGEPFTLPCGVVEPSWQDDIAPRQTAVAELAHEFNALFVPYQSAFDKACQRAPAHYWAADGVHPTPAGHYLMAQLWLDVVKSSGG